MEGETVKGLKFTYGKNHNYNDKFKLLKTWISDKYSFVVEENICIRNYNEEKLEYRRRLFNA